MDRKVAIVTGTSRKKGIGRAICMELAKRGFDIFFTYWTPYDKDMPWGIEAEEPNLIQKELREQGIRCEKLELDLAKAEVVDKLFEAVLRKLGPPMVLVNNATYSTQTSIYHLTAKELDKHYEVNLKATTLLIARFIKEFRYKENGRIINLTSGQSLGKMPNEIAYAITKAAIETLTLTLSSQIAEHGITINAVNPGPNNTGWMNKELENELLDRFPMKRIGQPSDTANLIGFLVSPEAAWITGQIIHSEGGFKR